MITTSLRIFTEDGVEVPLPRNADSRIDARLDLISGAFEWVRDVNGTLVDLGNPLFRRWRVALSCSDMVAAPFGTLHSDDLLTVHVPHILRERCVAGAVTLSRDPVPGSVVAFDADGAQVPATVSGRDVTAAGASVVAYRPVLTCRVTERSEGSVEGAAQADWSLTLEEA